MDKDLMFSSKDMTWGTPQKFFNKLNKEFNFNLDVCATENNRKCSNYFSPKDDGLKQQWWGICWMNPPYGREIGKWLKKAYEESLTGVIVVCLIPARTDTKYWHDYCMKAAEIRFVKGRLAFENDSGTTDPAPFPSAVIVFDKFFSELKVSSYDSL